MKAIIENLKNIQAIELENGFSNGELYNDCEDMISKLEIDGTLIEIETTQGDVYGGMTVKQRELWNQKK